MGNLRKNFSDEKWTAGRIMVPETSDPPENSDGSFFTRRKAPKNLSQHKGHILFIRITQV